MSCDIVDRYGYFRETSIEDSENRILWNVGIYLPARFHSLEDNRIRTCHYEHLKSPKKERSLYWGGH